MKFYISCCVQYSVPWVLGRLFFSEYIAVQHIALLCLEPLVQYFTPHYYFLFHAEYLLLQPFPLTVWEVFYSVTAPNTVSTVEGYILCRPHSGRKHFVQSPQWKVTFCAEPTVEGYILSRAHSGRLHFVQSPQWKVTFCAEPTVEG